MLTSMSRETWLATESERWERDGLITAEARRSILARYPTQQTDPSRILIPLAVLTAGVGVVLFVAWHWQDLPAIAKLALTFALTLVLFGGAWESAGRGRSRSWATELWLLGAALGSYTIFGALTDVYAWNQPQTVMLLCTVSAATIAAVTGATMVTALAAATLTWWLIVAGGGAVPWSFLAVFPLVAIAAEQSGHRAVAVLTAVAFAAFAMIAAANTWNASLPVMMFVVAAGAALEQWSRQPKARRPVFARATPGAAIAIGALTFALLTVVHETKSVRSLSIFATHAAQSPWPTIVLGIGLIVIGFGFTRDAALRPRVLAIIAALWLNAAVAGRRAPFSDVTWVVLFSAALLFLGASLVRESARTSDRGAFILGLAAVFALVLVHFSSGEPLRGSLVLLVSAAVLFVIGRKSRRAAAAPQEPQ